MGEEVAARQKELGKKRWCITTAATTTTTSTAAKSRELPTKAAQVDVEENGEGEPLSPLRVRGTEAYMKTILFRFSISAPLTHFAGSSPRLK